MTQGVSIHQRTAGILRIESYPLPRVIHEGRTQRSLSVWQRQEVQEVLPCQGPGGAVGATGPEFRLRLRLLRHFARFPPSHSSIRSLPGQPHRHAPRNLQHLPGRSIRRRERRESLAGVRVPERRGPDRRLPRDPGRRRGDDGRHGLRDAQHPPLRGREERRPRALRGVRRRTPRATARGVRSGCSLLSVLVPGWTPWRRAGRRSSPPWRGSWPPGPGATSTSSTGPGRPWPITASSTFSSRPCASHGRS